MDTRDRSARMSSPERIRKLSVDMKAADVMMSQLETMDCETLLSLLPRLHDLASDKTRQHLRRCGAKSPIILAGTQIPAEVMFKVLDWLDYETVMECRLVCRAFYEIVCDERLWTTIPDVAYAEGGCLDKITADLDKTLKIVRRYPRLRHWSIPKDLDFSGASKDTLCSIAKVLSNVRELSIHANNSSITREHLAVLLSGMPALRSLNVGLQLIPVDIASLTRININNKSYFNSGHLPMVRSETLRYLDYRYHDLDGTLNELLANCPNLRTLLGSSGIYTPLISASLRTLVVQIVSHPDGFEGCPALTEVHCKIARQAQNVWSDTLETLEMSHSGTIEADLRNFPSLKSYSIASISDPIVSDSLRNLAIDEHLALPTGSEVGRLEWLSVREVKDRKFGRGSQELSGATIAFKDCGWPSGLQVLRLIFHDTDDKSIKRYNKFVQDALEGLSRLRELHVNVNLIDSIQSDTLVELGVAGFAYGQSFAETATQCSSLRVIRICEGLSSKKYDYWEGLRNKHPITWLQDSFWETLDQEYKHANVHKQVVMMVPREHRKQMPQSFRVMLVEGRADYYDSNRDPFTVVAKRNETRNLEK